jgi:histidine ammonia-lyase
VKLVADWADSVGRLGINVRTSCGERRRARIAAAVALVLALTAVSACGSSDGHAESHASKRAANTSPSTVAVRDGSGSSTAPVPASRDRVIELDGKSLTVADIDDIAHARATVEISDDGLERIAAARAVVDHYVDAKLPAYGITTMYGADFKTTLPPDEMLRFGRINLIQEATRVGDGRLPIVDTGTMRAAWALLANSYARGFSGASPALAKTLVDRVNSGNVPDNVEFGNSMGGADLTSNAQAAMSLLADPHFELKADEATNLLTHNFISVAMAAQFVQRAKAILDGEEAALALTIEGFRANLGPLSQLDSREDVAGSRQSVKKALEQLLDGSKLREADGPRQLQDFLSLRDGAENLATLHLQIDQYVPVLEAFANSNQGSPVVDVEHETLTSVPDFDTSQVMLGLDSLRQAVGLVVVAANSRGLKLVSHPFIDLASGLASGDPNAFDGIYTRNITYIMTSLERAARLETQPVLGLTESYMAEGDEDYTPAFPNSALMADALADRAEEVMTLEALIGSTAIQRRLDKKELTNGDVPPALRDLHADIVKRSPLVRTLRVGAARIDRVEEQYLPVPFIVLTNDGA